MASRLPPLQDGSSGTASGIPLAGPDVAGKTDWVTRFAADEGKDAVLLTHHYYREGQNPGSTIEKLLGVDPKLQTQLEQLRAASQSCGVPYRICEVNSFSGGGRPGVSDTLAAALWVLDYMFTLASNGCSGVNMETGVNQLGFISSYSPSATMNRVITRPRRSTTACLPSRSLAGATCFRLKSMRPPCDQSLCHAAQRRRAGAYPDQQGRDGFCAASGYR